MNALKIFMTEYVELYKTNCKFWIKHWKAFCLITVIFVGAEFAIIEFDNIQYKVRRDRADEDLEKIRKAIENVEPEKVLERMNNK